MTQTKTESTFDSETILVVSNASGHLLDDILRALGFSAKRVSSVEKASRIQKPCRFVRIALARGRGDEKIEAIQMALLAKGCVDVTRLLAPRAIRIGNVLHPVNVPDPPAPKRVAALAVKMRAEDLRQRILYGGVL